MLLEIHTCARPNGDPERGSGSSEVEAFVESVPIKFGTKV